MKNQEPVPEPAQPPVQDQEPVQQQKRGRGRPVEREWPESIPDSPENIARALMSGPPKAEEDWRYLKKHQNRRKGQKTP